MTEKDGVTITGHVAVERVSGGGGLTVADLRMLLAGVEKAGLPDTSEVRARTSWRASEHGFSVKQITVVAPR